MNEQLPLEIETMPQLRGRKIVSYEMSRDLEKVVDFGTGIVVDLIQGRYQYLTVKLDSGESLCFTKCTYSGIITCDKI